MKCLGNMITALTIIDQMKKWVEEKHPISASLWLEVGIKLNILRGDLDDHLFDLEQEVATTKMQLMTGQDMTNAKAETIVKSSNTHREMRKAQAQIKQVEECIKIAKIQARLKNEEFINQR